MYSMKRTLHLPDSGADDGGCSCPDAGSDARSTSSPQHERTSPSLNPSSLACQDKHQSRRKIFSRQEDGNHAYRSEVRESESDSFDCTSVLNRGKSQPRSRGTAETPQTPTRQMVAAAASSCLNPTGERIVDSPLLHAPPNPSRSASEAGLVSLEGRWKAMAQLAGDHRQDPRLLDLTNRPLPPEALKFGVPPKVAAVVEDFRYDWRTVGKHNLPSFLDLVAQLFPKLRHINLKGDREQGYSAKGIRNGNHNELSINPALKRKLDANAAAAEKETVRMRRLYILYRLPDLDTIDEVPVSFEERSLARPSSPAGCRVRKDDWLTMSMAKSNADGSSEGESSSHHAAPGSLVDFHTISPPDGREDMESNTGSAIEVSFCGLVNYVRSPKRPDAAGPRTNGERSRIGYVHNRSEQRPSRISTSLPLQNDVVNMESFPTEKIIEMKGDRATLGADSVGESSTDMEQNAGCNDCLHTTGHRESPQDHIPRKGTIDLSGEQTNAPDLDETVGKRNAIRSIKKVPFRGSRPPPSPASKIRALPMLKERQGSKRSSSRRFWRQRKAATSMLDQEGDCTDEDESNESDLDEPADKDSDTKEILSSFLVGVD